MDNTFFNLKLDLEPNIIAMIYDILRMSTIQIITQMMIIFIIIRIYILIMIRKI